MAGIEWQQKQMKVPYSGDRPVPARLVPPDEITAWRQVEVTAAESIGLGYHLGFDPDETGKLVIVHLASGYRLSGGVNSEATARRWIELLSPVLDWKQAAPGLFELSAEERLTISQAIAAARVLAIRETRTHEVAP